MSTCLLCACQLCPWHKLIKVEQLDKKRYILIKWVPCIMANLYSPRVSLSPHSDQPWLLLKFNSKNWISSEGVSGSRQTNEKPLRWLRKCFSQTIHHLASPSIQVATKLTLTPLSSARQTRGKEDRDHLFREGHHLLVHLSTSSSHLGQHAFHPLRILNCIVFCNTSYVFIPLT